VNLEHEARTSTVATKLTEWHAGGETGKQGLPVALDEKVTAFILSTDEKQQAAFVDILDEIVKVGMVPLKETPVHRDPNRSTDSSVLKEVEAGIKKLMDDTEGLSYGDASSQFFLENDAMYAKYQASLEESTEVEN